MLSAVLTACGGGVGTEPSAYTAKIYPMEGDFDRYETVGPFSSRDECTAKAKEMIIDSTVRKELDRYIAIEEAKKLASNMG